MGWFSRADSGFFLATVFPDNDAARVARYLGIVHGEAIIGANIFRDMFSSVRDIVGGRAGGYERALWAHVTDSTTPASPRASWCRVRAGARDRCTV